VSRIRRSFGSSSVFISSISVFVSKCSLSGRDAVISEQRNVFICILTCLLCCRIFLHQTTSFVLKIGFTYEVLSDLGRGAQGLQESSRNLKLSVALLKNHTDMLDLCLHFLPCLSQVCAMEKLVAMLLFVSSREITQMRVDGGGTKLKFVSSRYSGFYGTWFQDE
jgi:hypothetical protein